MLLFAFGQRSSSPGEAEHLVAILQYLASDYPSAVASGDRGELAEQSSLSTEAVAIARRTSIPSSYVDRVAAIDGRVRQGVDAKAVSADCALLVDDLVVAAGVARAPSVPPNLEDGAHLFSTSCAPCHGATGQGDGPAAVALTPKPANFQSPTVMGDLTPFKAFNVIRFGVKGTAMAPFLNLGERERWALAFYVFTFRQPPCDGPPSKLSLEALANGTDDEIAASAGPGGVACARRKMVDLDAPARIAAAREGVSRGMHFARAGHAQAAEQAVLDAYLTDIEPIEPWLRARDAALVTEIETAFTATRSAIQAAQPSAQASGARLVELLDRAAGVRPVATRLSVFWFSLAVILREGFEATVIIAALLAVLKKGKQVARARWVHAGWASAIAVGIGVFTVGRQVLAGAMNEKVEGGLAFVAVAMLLHAAFWLNARATTRKTMGDLRDRTRGALGQGAFALFAIAFLAMFRESFETAVFLEALAVDAPSAVVWGALAGVLVLSASVFAVGRLGLRLPMQALFKVSTGVLLATAVVLIGQGVHAFEEVGLLPSRPMAFFRIEFLGIYPDRIGVMAQCALALVPLVWKMALRSRTLRPSPLETG